MATRLLTTSHFRVSTLLEHSVSSIGTEPTVPPRLTGSVLEQTVSTTSTDQHPAMHVVLLDTTTLTTHNPTSGADSLSAQDTTDEWLRVEAPPTR